MTQLSDAASKQGELWGKAVRDWVEFVEPNAQPLWQAALEAASVSPGVKLLDAGCGAGGASLLAAQMGADVSGVDASVPMITMARKRLPHADLRIGELQELPYPNGGFDSVVAINSLQFAAEPRLALHELGRVARSGGRVVVVVWDMPELSDMRAMFDAVQSLFDKKPTGRGPFALSDPDALETLFASVQGLELKEIVPVACDFSYTNIGTALRAQMSTGPTQRAVEIHGEEKVSDVLRRALSLFVQTDGTVLLRNRFRRALALYQ